ncbi:MAG: hypothetical protein J7L96_02905, partial [Bacteroidales bacterium]|nr:hypothetical protein [Bacteroidales bacterium]
MMKTFVKKISVYFSRIMTVLLFIAAVISVYYLFPRQGTFPYEFQKGSPWMHETLIAQFDFPILKTNDDLLKERDSILAGFKPYFKYDENIGLEKVKQQRDVFPLVWERFIHSNFLDTLFSDSLLRYWEAVYSLQVSSGLDSIYRMGVLPDISEIELLANVNNGIQVVRNKIVSERLPGEVVGTLESYQRLKHILQDSVALPGIDKALADKLFSEVGFNRYIVSNLSYDPETSNAVQKSLLDEVSTTRGLVQEGQRIIGRGEMITDEGYTILESFRTAYEALTGDITTIWLIRIGQIVLIVMCFVALFFFMMHYKPAILKSNLKLSFILLMIVIAV